jgi:predicted O-linked N-acetylglucosamine transferase (SPINDLY family)
VDPKDVSSTLARAVELHASGDLDGAGLAFESLLLAIPDNARLIAQLGLIRSRQGRHAEAAQLFERATTLDPLAPEPHAGRGELLLLQDRLDLSIGSFQQALRLRRDYAPAWFNLGLAYERAERPAEARRAWIDFLRLRPRDNRVRRELGSLAFASRQFDEALAWFREQLDLDPGNIVSRCDLAATHLRMRNWTGAEEVLRTAAGDASENARAALLLGQALYGQDRIVEAASHLEIAHSLDPTSVDAAFDLGLAHDRLANLQSAIRAYEAAVTLAPGRADYVAALAVAELNLGNAERAIAHYRRAVEMDPESPELHSALLMALHYAEPDHSAMFEEHLRWAARHAAGMAASPGSFGNARDPDRKLRVGYVSPRFGRGPLAHLFLPLLKAHDRNRVEIFCYMVSTSHDSVTEEFRSRSDAWREHAHTPDAELLQIIRDDRIDILVDTAGHCPGNRLGVFARRAAPIQISWLDYDDTTGVPAMDYYLSDARLTPPGGAQRFTETVACPAAVRVPYAHTASLPDPGPLPALARGSVTFGCINRISKIGPAVVAAWSRILERTPRSRLILQGTAFASVEPQDVVRQRFGSHGIAPERIVLRPFSDEEAMLRLYRDIDIALDPFPYNGCTSTCDALSMGVPVVTLEGTTLCGRHGFALLSACGLESWITPTVDDYVDRACGAATALREISSLRGELPTRFSKSPLCDNAAFAGAIEQLYRSVWTTWCQTIEEGAAAESP